MKTNVRNGIIHSALLLFAIFTGYVIAGASHHREQADLVFIMFTAYALLAVIFSVLFVLYRQRGEKRAREDLHRHLKQLTENLTYPSMLWNSSFETVIINRPLSALSELTIREDFDPRLVVPVFFGKKALTPEDLQELLENPQKEYPFTAPNGKKYSLIWSVSSVLTESDGTTWYLAVGMDLAATRTMQSEIEEYSKRLAVSERKYALIMNMTDIGILLIQQGNPRLYLSEKLAAMIGVQGDSITAHELRKRVYMPDILTFDNQVRTMQTNMRSYLGKTGIMELRLCAADRQYRCYAFRFSASEDSSGRLTVGGAVIDITEEKLKDARMERIAYEDSVTGLPNRSKLMQMGEELYECTVDVGNSYWVIAMDIDRFHIVNDTCGYDAGNELLRAFADTMREQLNAGGFGARISGDNFALILRDSGDDSLPQQVISRIQRRLPARAGQAFANRTLTCSAGYAKMPADGASFEQVLKHAEFALSSGSRILGSSERYTSVMHDAIIHETSLESELGEAVMRGELKLYYQPKISLATGEIVGLEALIRWQHPNGQLLTPDLFIPLAEKSSLISQITRFVLDEACCQAHLWKTIGLPDIVMSVNVSSTDFYQENLCALIRKSLDKYGIAPEKFEIELTETLALKDIDITIMQMRQLREAGIQIAMDDFGTGYSSLGYIQRLPFTMLKLDRSFVMDMESDTVVQEIISSVVRIAKAKKIRTIAEGVETPEQAHLLRKMGCDCVQGFLCGHPMTAKETERFIRENMKQRVVY